MKKNNTIADLIEKRFGLNTDAGRDMQGFDELTNILNHRSHRRYKDEPISDKLLEVLLAAAFSAPAKSDLQQSSVVVIRDKEKQEAIADMIPAMPWLRTCPVLMIFLGDSRRIRRICEMRNKTFANDHLDAFLNAALDAGLVLMNFIRAAEAAGLGCCPISVIRNHIEEVAQLLELPDFVFPVAGMTAGYPSDDGYLSLRLPPAVNVHINTYNDAQLEQEIDSYDKRRDSIFSIPPDKQRKVEEYGVANFYGWSEDKARQVSSRERDQLATYLSKKGFNLG
ncbi:MAG: nitroreductase family protein [Pseudomonadota bacterium]|nr:nitroreductase family protein [Pseudomonadota bacterium]